MTEPSPGPAAVSAPAAASKPAAAPEPATLSDTATASKPMAKSNRKRKKALGAVLGAFVASGLGYGAYWFLAARHVVSTDDAYVDGNVVELTPWNEGAVVAISADDTDYVEAGQALVELDRADAEVALKRSQARLGETVREVRNLFAKTEQLEAAVAVREAELAKARADVARRENLAASGAVSAEELHHAQESLRAATSALAAAQEELAANTALTDRTTVAAHPRVAQAAAELRAAYLDYQRTVLPAPVAGVVAKRSVQLGQRVSPGKPLMAIVPLDEVWVDANFKEPQLERLRVGQRVRLRADANGIEYHGEIVGLSAGTGAAFALLPPQNATGNWIKVVQRLPVRIALDPEEIAAHPLAIGLSMQVDVDVRVQPVAPARQAVSTDPAYRTAVYERQEAGADELIARIIARNGGDEPRVSARPENEEPQISARR